MHLANDIIALWEALLQFTVKSKHSTRIFTCLPVLGHFEPAALADFAFSFHNLDVTVFTADWYLLTRNDCRDFNFIIIILMEVFLFFYLFYPPTPYIFLD